MIRLVTLPNAIDASFLQQKLELEGIESFTTNEYFSTMLPHLYGIMGAGIQVMVSESDYEKAKGVLLTTHLTSDVLKVSELRIHQYWVWPSGKETIW